MRDITVVPEFLTLLSRHLDTASLGNCVCVSKSWHAILVPRLWYDFGTPGRPTRFGIGQKPYTAASVTFPLQVLDPQSTTPSSLCPPQTISALSIACESHYPNLSTTYLCNDHRRRRSSPWDALLSGLPIPDNAARALRPMVAKYARHIRRLTVRSLDAFRLFEAHCTELTAFHCRFEPRRVGGRWVYWHSTLAVSEMQQAHRDVHAFAVRQTKLDSINYTSGLMDPAVVRAWLVASSSGSRWRHLDVYLDEDDYRDIVQLLPNVHSARFAMADLTVLYDLLPEPHLHLRELQLWAPRLDHQALVGILTSFPRLQRLVVRCDIEAQPPLIDLTIDHGSMLYVGPDGCPPGDIGRLLAAVAPPLLILDYADRDFRATLEAVAEHCQELLYFECSAGSRTGPYVPLHGSTRLGASRRSNALMGGGAGLHQPELIRA